MARSLLVDLELPVRTDRLLIRLPSATDVPALVRVLNDRRVYRGTLSIPFPYSEADARRWIRNSGRRRRAGESIGFLIFDRSGQTLIGGVGLDRIQWGHRRAELGYWISPRHWGNGYATEAAGAVCREGFETLGLHRIEAGVFGFNVASARVLEKLGFVREGRGRKVFRKSGRWHDDLTFGLLVGELRLPGDGGEARSRRPRRRPVTVRSRGAQNPAR